MWDLIVSVPDHCLSFYFQTSSSRVELVELVLLYKLYPTTAGLNDGVTNQRQSKYMQSFNNSKK